MNCKDFSHSYIIQTAPICNIFGCCHVERSRILSQAFEAQLGLRNILPMPITLTAEHIAQIEQVAALHEQELAANYAGVFFSSALDIKYKYAAKEFAWQWLFPAKSLTLARGSEDYRCYHFARNPRAARH